MHKCLPWSEKGSLTHCDIKKTKHLPLLHSWMTKSKKSKFKKEVNHHGFFFFFCSFRRAFYLDLDFCEKAFWFCFCPTTIGKSCEMENVQSCIGLGTGVFKGVFNVKLLEDLLKSFNSSDIICKLSIVITIFLSCRF